MTDWDIIPIWSGAEENNMILQFTEVELQAAARKLLTGKAPEPDRIVNEILSALVRCNPAALIEVCNSCLRAEAFPKDWKTAAVCLLYKGPEKPVAESNSFRPISLLDGFGKLYERIILNRVAANIDAKLSQNQYGFRPGRGTEDAIGTVLRIAGEELREVVQDRHLCVMITLDVKNAFNTAPWRLIDAVVAGFGLPTFFRKLAKSYLSERSLLVPSGNTNHSRAMSCGVPQESVFGPTLWNIFYNGLLRIRLPDGASLIGFADDIALIVVNQKTEGLEAAMNMALNIVEGWMSEHGNQLTKAKTETLMLTRKWAYRQPNIFVGGHYVRLSRSAKYLGITLDLKLTYTRHIRAASASATKTAKAIGIW